MLRSTDSDPPKVKNELSGSPFSGVSDSSETNGVVNLFSQSMRLPPRKKNVNKKNDGYSHTPTTSATLTDVALDDAQTHMNKYIEQIQHMQIQQKPHTTQTVKKPEIHIMQTTTNNINNTNDTTGTIPRLPLRDHSSDPNTSDYESKLKKSMTESQTKQQRARSVQPPSHNLFLESSMINDIFSTLLSFFHNVLHNVLYDVWFIISKCILHKQINVTYIYVHIFLILFCLFLVAISDEC